MSELAQETRKDTEPLESQTTTPAPTLGADEDELDSDYQPSLDLLVPGMLLLGSSTEAEVKLKSKKAPPADVSVTLELWSRDEDVLAVTAKEPVPVTTKAHSEVYSIKAAAPGETDVVADLFREANMKELATRRVPVQVPEAKVEWEVERLAHSNKFPGQHDRIVQSTTHDGVPIGGDQLLVRARVGSVADLDALDPRFVIQGDILNFFDYEQLPREADHESGAAVVTYRFTPKPGQLGEIRMQLGLDLAGHETSQFEHVCHVVMSREDFGWRIANASKAVTDGYLQLGLVFDAWTSAFKTAHSAYTGAIDDERQFRRAQAREKRMIEDIAYEFIFTAVISAVTGGVGGVLGSALAKAKAGAWLIDGSKDAFKGVARAAASYLQRSPNSGTPGAASSHHDLSALGGVAEAFAPLTLSDIGSLTEQVGAYVKTEGRRLSGILDPMVQNPETFPLNFDPIAEVTERLVLDGYPLKDLPEPGEELKSAMELSMWKEWLHENTVELRWEAVDRNDGIWSSEVVEELTPREATWRDGPAAARIKLLCELTETSFEQLVIDALNTAYARARKDPTVGQRRSETHTVVMD